MHQHSYRRGDRRRHLTGDTAWEAFASLGGDGLAANHAGWHRRPCPAHDSRSGNSLAFKLDESTGIATLIVHDFAGCSERQVLEAVGFDTAGLVGIDGLRTAEWLRRGIRRPAAFEAMTDPTTVVTDDAEWMDYFAAKRGFDVEVLRRAGVTIVQHPYRYRRERDLNVRARFPFICDGQVLGAADRAIVDIGPGGYRWITRWRTARDGDGDAVTGTTRVSVHILSINVAKTTGIRRCIEMYRLPMTCDPSPQAHVGGC